MDEGGVLPLLALQVELRKFSGGIYGAVPKYRQCLRDFVSHPLTRATLAKYCYYFQFPCEECTER